MKGLRDTGYYNILDKARLYHDNGDCDPAVCPWEHTLVEDRDYLPIPMPFLDNREIEKSLEKLRAIKDD